MKRLTKQLLQLLAIPLLCAAGSILAIADPLSSRDDIKQIIVDASANSDRVPAWIALAVAEVSSDFSADKAGPSGERGVMQLQPRVAIEDLGVNPDDLWEPAVNVWAGINYLEKLHQLYDGRWEAVLSHYEGGELKGLTHAAKPHRSNREFVKQVLNLALDYQLDGYPAPTPVLGLRKRYTYSSCDFQRLPCSTDRNQLAHHHTHIKYGELNPYGSEWHRGNYWINTSNGVVYSDELLPPTKVNSDSKLWFSRLRGAFRAELAEREYPWFTKDRVQPITESD